jgi:uncharacterized LabA/DUF88 family protein
MYLPRHHHIADETAGMKKMNGNKDERVMVFIDLRNVLKSAEKFSRDITIDFREMVEAVVGERRLIAVNMFDGIECEYDSHNYFDDMMMEEGFYIFSRDCYESSTRTQKEVDVAMACKMVSYASRDMYDTAIVISGDRDFKPAIENVQEMGKKVEVAGVSEGMSRRLSACCDVFHNLDQVPMFFLKPEMWAYYDNTEIFAHPIANIAGAVC